MSLGPPRTESKHGSPPSSISEGRGYATRLKLDYNLVVSIQCSKNLPITYPNTKCSHNPLDPRTDKILSNNFCQLVYQLVISRTNLELKSALQLLKSTLHRGIQSLVR